MDYSFYYWGPYLHMVRVDKEVCDELFKKGLKLRAAKKNKKGFNKYSHNIRLAGQLKEEYSYPTDKWFIKRFQKYVNSYIEGYRRWIGNLSYSPKAEFKNMWINFQRQYEWNPLHTHTQCTHSFVLYLQIPPEIKKERESFIAETKDAGTISFHHGEKREFYADSHNFFPEVGQLFIFPSSLKHMVSPFRSNVERVSVAGNFVLYD